MKNYDDVLKEMAEDAFNVYKENFKNNPISNFPLFVFTKKSECDYFKMFLLKNYSDSNNCVFLNLQTKTLDDFIFDLLKGQDSQFKDKRLLTADVLRDLIVYVLNDEQCSLLKKYENLKTFLTSNTINTEENRDKINPVNLYDLALNLSKLYVEYSQNNIQWKAYKKENSLVDNGWQVELYEKLKETFWIDKKDGVKPNENQTFYKDYVSLAALYEKIDKENIKLLQNTYFFDNKCRIKYNLYENILAGLKKNNADRFKHFVIEESDDNKKEIKFNKVISAKSRIREIEGIHAEICKLIHDKKIKNLDDILILVSDIGEYRSAIHQVFSIAKNQEEKSDFKYPYIPVDIGQISMESQISNALKVLFEIAENGYYTRKDFFNLLSFSVVKEKFNITEDDILSYKEAIEDMNVYRKKNEWDEGRKRLLLSLLMDKDKEFDNNGKQLIAYNTLFGMSSDAIAKFSSLVLILEKWLGVFQKGKYIPDEISVEKFEIIVDVIEELLMVETSFEEDEIKCENLILRSVISKIYNLKKLYESKKLISYYVFRETILDSIKEISFSDDLSIKGGVRVLQIDLSCPVKCKYLFLVGFASNKFVIEKCENVLDIQQDIIANYADEMQKQKKLVSKEQIYSADEFWVSFTNKDLKKDEDFYLSSEVEMLLEKLGAVNMIELGLNWKKEIDTDELWTAHEYRNKSYVLQYEQRGTNNE